MATVRYTEEGQEDRRKHLEALRMRRAAIVRLGTMKDSGDWKELKRVLDSFIEMEKKREELYVIACLSTEDEPWKSVSDLRACRERRSAFELINDVVEKTSESVSHIDATIGAVEDKYKMAKEQLA